jgi:DNA-binding transcriptional MerR regulator
MKEILPIALKIQEAARKLGISPGRLRELSDTGGIPCKRLNRERYFCVKDLEKWVGTLPDWTEENGDSAQTQRKMDSGLSIAAPARQ